MKLSKRLCCILLVSGSLCLTAAMATGASSASTRAGATKTSSNSAKAGSGVLTASLNEAPVSLDPEGAESVNGGTDEVCGNTLSGLVAERGRHARERALSPRAGRNRTQIPGTLLSIRKHVGRMAPPSPPLT